MPFDSFLKLVCTVRSIYDKQTAQTLFENNIGQFYNLGKFNPKKDVKIPLHFEEVGLQ